MRVADLAPHVTLAIGALAGFGAGVAGARLADVLPARSGITHLVTGSGRTRRNVVVVVLATAFGVWLAQLAEATPDASLERGAIRFAPNLVIAVALIAAAAIDIEHMVLPNELTLGGALLAFATSPFRGVAVVGSIAGGVVGLALTVLPFLLYKRLRGRSGMGLGDAKLALLAGAWLGVEGAIFVVFAGAVQSALCALGMRALRLDFPVPASVQAELADLRAKADAGDAEARALLADDPMAADVGDPVSRSAAAPSAGVDEDKPSPPNLATMRMPMGPFLVLACFEFVFAQRLILDVFRYVAAPR